MTCRFFRDGESCDLEATHAVTSPQGRSEFLCCEAHAGLFENTHFTVRKIQGAAPGGPLIVRPSKKKTPRQCGEQTAGLLDL